ncbi:MAG: tol-pal system protein YbgF [Geminicoccaceae bacterium]
MWRFLILLGFVAAPAWAAEPGSLRADAARIARELSGIRLAQAQDPALRAAGLEIRLARLEEQLRQLTGRIEEVEHAQAQTASRIDELVADLDARLSGRPRAAEGSTQAPQQQAAVAPAPVATPPRRDIPPSIIAPDQAAQEGHVLGTIPPDAAANPPKPQPAPQSETPASQAALTPQGADARYQQALDLLQSGSWAQAEQAFSGFVQAYPEDARVPNASYWLGETYLFRKDYPTAASVFARNYRTYGQAAPRAPDNLLKLGVALSAMGDKNRACQTFAELAKRHPKAPAPIMQALAREKSAAGCS